REELVVPVKREPGQREDRDGGTVEGEDEEDRDRRVEEHDYEREEDAHDPSAGGRECDVHQAACASPALRKRTKTRVRTAITASRNSASTDPVSQSGNPVPKRSTIWFPYM